MGLALDAGVLDHGAGVGLEAGHGTANVAVDLYNLLDGGGLEEGGGDALLDAEDDAFGGGDADCGGAELDGFEGVFDLEEATFGREGAKTVGLARCARGRRERKEQGPEPEPVNGGMRTYLIPRSAIRDRIVSDVSPIASSDPWQSQLGLGSQGFGAYRIPTLP